MHSFESISSSSASGLCRSVFSAACTLNRLLYCGRYLFRNSLPSLIELTPASLISLTTLSWNVPNSLSIRPFAGAGLWAVISPVHGPDQQAGMALMARAPVGVEWNLDTDHHFGADLALNRALWVRRRDPRDETPPTDRLIPLPGFYYRWKR